MAKLLHRLATLRSHLSTLQRLCRPGLVGVFVAAAPALAGAATFIVPPPYPPSPKHYVLYGEVTRSVRYDKPVCPTVILDAPCEVPWGLEIAVTDTVYTPDRRYAKAQIFGFEADPDCVTPPLATYLGVECFPVGTKLKISASRIESDDPASKVLRLDHFFRPLSIVERLPDSVDLHAASGSARDYRFAQGYYDDDQLFELRKDFARLRTAAPREAADIIRRLAFYDGDKRTFDGSPSKAEAVARLVADYGIDKATAAELRSVAEDADLLSAGEWPDDGYASPFARLLGLAERGDPLAQTALGVELLADGELEKAVFWLDVADKSGYPLAQVYAAFAYRGLAQEHYQESSAGATPPASDVWRAEAAARFARSIATARKLARTEDPEGLVMFSTLYGDEDAGKGEELLPDSDEVQRHACAGLEFRPIWQQTREHDRVYDAVWQRAHGCDRFSQ